MNFLFGKNVATAIAELVRPADTTAYAANDVVSNNTSASTLLAFDVMREGGTSAYLVSARLTTNQKSITPRIRVHVFNATSVTVAADNAAYKSVYADFSKRVAVFDLPALTTAADTTNSDSSHASDHTLRIPVSAAPGDTKLYVLLETLDAFTPTSGQKFSLALTVDRY